jgi:hypothetical protein
VSCTSTSSLRAASGAKGVTQALEGLEKTPSDAAVAAARASAAAAAAAAAGEFHPCGPFPASLIRDAIFSLQHLQDKNSQGYMSIAKPAFTRAGTDFRQTGCDTRDQVVKLGLPWVVHHLQIRHIRKHILVCLWQDTGKPSIDGPIPGSTVETLGRLQ